MPNPRLLTIPHPTRHASGQAVVRLQGKDFYLGKFGTPQARQAYDRLIQEWLTNGRQPPSGTKTLLINDLILRYFHHCQGHYRKHNGTPTSELDLVKQALRPLRRLYGNTGAENFGPLALKSVRKEMIDKNLSRSVINKHVGRIKQMFRWAVENELVHPSVYHGLQAVKGLQRGRSEARETEPVRPAPEPLIQAVHPFVSRQVWAMIQLQLFTGMRPGEVCAMRGCDIDMLGSIWVYRPADHKTQHHGFHREIYIGPRGQEVVRLFLKGANEAFLFSPSEAREEQFQRMRATRKTKVQPSQACRRKDKAKRLPGEKYDVASYRRAIAYACVRAFPLPEELGPSRKETKTGWKARLTEEEKAKVQVWRRQHSWHPHQLRHNAASGLRKEFGIELARIILGHRTAFTTEIYAEVDRKQAMVAIGQVG